MKKSNKEYCAEIKFAAFDYDVRLVFSNDIIKSRKKRDDILGVLDDDTDCRGMHSYKSGSFQSYIFIRPSVGPDTIAHESWHAVRRMLRECGADLENEVVAYHLGYLVGEIHKAQARARGKA